MLLVPRRSLNPVCPDASQAFSFNSLLPQPERNIRDLRDINFSHVFLPFLLFLVSFLVMSTTKVQSDPHQQRLCPEYWTWPVKAVLATDITFCASPPVGVGRYIYIP